MGTNLGDPNQAPAALPRAEVRIATPAHQFVDFPSAKEYLAQALPTLQSCSSSES